MRKCCVPGCFSNYNKPYVPTFVFPKNEKRRKQWEKILKAVDVKISGNVGVCIKHFDPKYVMHVESVVDQSDSSSSLRRKVKLKPDAFPTIINPSDDIPDSGENNSDFNLKSPKAATRSSAGNKPKRQRRRKSTASPKNLKSPPSAKMGEENDSLLFSKIFQNSKTTVTPIITVLKAEDIEEMASTNDDNMEFVDTPSESLAFFDDLSLDQFSSSSVARSRSEDKTSGSRERSSPKKRSPSVGSNSSNGSSETAKSSSVQKRRRVEKPAPLVIGKKNDCYCWVCHKEGVSASCFVCPRAYHARCAGEAEVLEDDDWVCPECCRITAAENVDSRSKTLSEISLEKFCMLLKCCISKLRCRAPAAFHQPVPVEYYSSYLHYVIRPMDLGTIEKNVKAKMYGCTESFLADIKWIQHNSVVFNGPQHPLSVSAKSVVKSCEADMAEIEVCPDCYLHAATRNKYWFSELCRKPHSLVWAKLKGFPYWPAKVVRIQDGNIDARFFGAHDRAWVPVVQCFHLSKEMPTTTKPKKKGNYDVALEELSVHVAHLKRKYGKFQYAPSRLPFNPDDKLYAFIESDKISGKDSAFTTNESSECTTPSPTVSTPPVMCSDSDTTTKVSQNGNEVPEDARAKITRSLIFDISSESQTNDSDTSGTIKKQVPNEVSKDTDTSGGPKIKRKGFNIQSPSNPLNSGKYQSTLQKLRELLFSEKDSKLDGSADSEQKGMEGDESSEKNEEATTETQKNDAPTIVPSDKSASTSSQKFMRLNPRDTGQEDKMETSVDVSRKSLAALPESGNVVSTETKNELCPIESGKDILASELPKTSLDAAVEDNKDSTAPETSVKVTEEIAKEPDLPGDSNKNVSTLKPSEKSDGISTALDCDNSIVDLLKEVQDSLRSLTDEQDLQEVGKESLIPASACGVLSEESSKTDKQDNVLNPSSTPAVIEADPIALLSTDKVISESAISAPPPPAPKLDAFNLKLDKTIQSCLAKLGMTEIKDDHSTSSDSGSDEDDSEDEESDENKEGSSATASSEESEEDENDESASSSSSSDAESDAKEENESKAHHPNDTHLLSSESSSKSIIEIKSTAASDVLMEIGDESVPDDKEEEPKDVNLIDDISEETEIKKSTTIILNDESNQTTADVVNEQLLMEVVSGTEAAPETRASEIPSSKPAVAEQEKPMEIEDMVSVFADAVRTNTRSAQNSSDLEISEIKNSNDENIESTKYFDDVSQSSSNDDVLDEAEISEILNFIIDSSLLRSKSPEKKISSSGSTSISESKEIVTVSTDKSSTDEADKHTFPNDASGDDESYPMHWMIQNTVSMAGNWQENTPDAMKNSIAEDRRRIVNDSNPNKDKITLKTIDCIELISSDSEPEDIIEENPPQKSLSTIHTEVIDLSSDEDESSPVKNKDSAILEKSSESHLNSSVKRALSNDDDDKPLELHDAKKFKVTSSIKSENMQSVSQPTLNDESLGSCLVTDDEEASLNDSNEKVSGVANDPLEYVGQIVEKSDESSSVVVNLGDAWIHNSDMKIKETDGDVTTGSSAETISPDIVCEKNESSQNEELNACPKIKTEKEIPECQILTPAAKANKSDAALGKHLSAKQLAIFRGEGTQESSSSQVRHKIKLENNADRLKEIVQSQRETIRLFKLKIEKMEWYHSQELIELQHNMNLVLMEMRSALEVTRKSELAAVEALKKKHQEELSKAVSESKEKQWCATCKQPAIFYCCWNTSYCSHACQKHHWPFHRFTCSQVKPPPLTSPAPSTELMKIPKKPTNQEVQGSTAEKKVVYLSIKSGSDVSQALTSSSQSFSTTVTNSQKVQVMSSKPQQFQIVSPSTQANGSLILQNTPVQFVLAPAKQTDTTSISSVHPPAQKVAQDSSDIITKVRSRQTNLQAAIELLNQMNKETEEGLKKNHGDRTSAQKNMDIEFISPNDSGSKLKIDDIISVHESSAISSKTLEDSISKMVSLGKNVQLNEACLQNCLKSRGQSPVSLTRALMDVFFPDTALLAESYVYEWLASDGSVPKPNLPDDIMESITDFVLKVFPSAKRMEIMLAMNLKCKEAFRQREVKTTQEESVQQPSSSSSISVTTSSTTVSNLAQLAVSLSTPAVSSGSTTIAIPTSVVESIKSINPKKLQIISGNGQGRSNRMILPHVKSMIVPGPPSKSQVSVKPKPLAITPKPPTGNYVQLPTGLFKLVSAPSGSQNTVQTSPAKNTSLSGTEFLSNPIFCTVQAAKPPEPNTGQNIAISEPAISAQCAVSTEITAKRPIIVGSNRQPTSPVRPHVVLSLAPQHPES